MLFTSSAFAATVVSGTISENTPWTTDGSPYVLSNDVTVASGITLTVQTGVVVKPISSGTSLIVNGSLDATGAIFTSYRDDAHGGDTNSDGSGTSPVAGDWMNITFTSGSSGTISGCSILYGGRYYANISEIYIAGGSPTITGNIISSSQSSGIYESSGTPSITNNTISGNQGPYGIYLSTRPAALYGNTISNNPNAVAACIPANLGQDTVYNNTYSGNKQNAMFLNGNAAISANTVWPASNSPYVIGSNGNINVQNNSALNIESGTVVKFWTSYSTYWDRLQVYAGAVLNATNVVFTSYYDDAAGGDTNGDGAATSPDAGNWGSIYFNGGGGTLSGCTVKYGGGSQLSEIIVDNNSAPTITGSTVSLSSSSGIISNPGNLTITNDTVSDNLGQYGIYLSTRPAALYGNTIRDNPNAIAAFIPATLGQGAIYNNTYSGNRQNAMFLNGSSAVSASTSWPASNSPYVIGFNGNINLQSNATLTIDPGVIVKFWTNTSNNWDCIQVYAGSTLNATSVVFTSYYDDAYAGDTNGDGSATSPAPGNWGYIYFNGGGGTLSNDTIRYGGGSSFALSEVFIDSGATPTITGSSISYSQRDGIFIQSASPSIHFDDIFANSTSYYGLYNNSSASLDTINNYWGSKHGPKPYGSGNGYYGATVAPWSRLPFTQAGAAYQATLGMDDWCAMCGDPINTATGAFVYQHKDIDIPTKGLPLEFERTYNSNDQTDGALGYGWSYTWQISANLLANSNVVILRGDGRQDVFSKNPDGSYSAPAGRHDALVKNPDGTYKLTTKDQVTYNFNADNQLSSLVSESGQSTGFTYDANKRLSTITEPTGRVITISYNADNRIDHLTDPQSHIITFTYSTAGDLTSATDQNGGVTSFAYDGFHHVTSVTDPNNHTSANNTYDAQGRVISQTDAESHLLSFAYSAGQTTMTKQMDPNDPGKDRVTVFNYDSSYRLVSEVDPLGKQTSFTYDSAGNRDSVTDRRGTVTRQVFDPLGNITDTYKAYGAPEQEHAHYSYNAKNHPISMTDARGYTTSYTYDATSRYLIQISYPQITNYDGSTSSYTEAFSYNADGTLATSTDRNGDVTSLTYDSVGMPDIVTRNTNRAAADQVTENYDFDSLGRKTRAVDGNGHTTTFEYDDLGQPRFIASKVTDPGTSQLVDVITEYRYDAAGNKTAQIDPEGKLTAFDYSPMNHLSQITDAKLNTIQYTYDAAGNKTESKDRNGNWSHFAFDKNNHMVSSSDPENNITSYAYDDEGNQTSATDPLARTTTRTYDRIDRVTASTEPDEGGAARTTNYAFDAADHMTSVTDPLSHTTASTYDELGRLRQKADPLLNSTYNAYDGMGNRVKMKDLKVNETVFAYSPNDSLITVTEPAGGVTSYSYDKAGNRTSQTDAESRVTLYGFDELNRLKSEKVDAGSGNYLLQRSYTFDKAGHPLTETNDSGTITSTYDNVYNLTGLTDRQGATFSYTYDNNQNQLSAIENATGKTVSFGYSSRGLLAASSDANGGSESYAYDSAGNLSQRQDSVAGQSFTTSYAYTPRGQMKTLTRGTDTSAFTYDPAGNLASKTYPNGVSTTYSYDAANRLTAQQAARSGQSLQSFTQAYDAAGNITSATQAGQGTTTYTYDALNRLTAENISGYGNTGYTYDKTGNRLTRTEPRPTGGPTLSLARIRSYWATYSDYQASQLSIDYRITDNGPGTAIGAKVTNSTATNGVYLSSAMPLALGNINQGSYAPFTLKYFVPAGVVSFTTTSYSTCENAAGTDFYYPEKKSFYSYNKANQLTSSRDAQGNSTAYTYNAAGAVAGKTTGTSITTNTYNGLDRLMGVTLPTAAITYGYDPLGRREARTESGQTTNSYFMGKSDLEDYQTDAGGNLSYAATRGADGLMAETDYTGQTPSTNYNLYNPHGDTSATTDQSGALTASYRYDAFGNPISQSSPREGYTGKWQREKDSATGTIRMGVREYDPGLGRFTSADPLRGSAAEPLQRNRYQYTGNVPLTRYDISGLYWGESAVDAAVGTWNDYQAGGVDALVNDWQTGFNSMSTGQQVVLLGVPAVTGAAIVGVEAAGVGGTVIAGEAAAGAVGDELATEGTELLEKEGSSCADKLSEFVPEAIKNDPRLFDRWLNSKTAVESPLTHDQARKVLETAEKLGFETRGPEAGVRGKIWSGIEHIHVGTHHIPVEPGFEP